MVGDRLGPDARPVGLGSELAPRRRHPLGEMVPAVARVHDKTSRLGHRIALALDKDSAVADDGAVAGHGHDRVHASVAQRLRDVARFVEQRILVRVAVAAIDAADQSDRIAWLHRPNLERLDLRVGYGRRVLVEDLLAAEVGLERLQPQRAFGEVALLAAGADVELVDESERGEPTRGRVARLPRGKRQARVSDLDPKQTGLRPGADDCGVFVVARPGPRNASRTSSSTTARTRVARSGRTPAAAASARTTAPAASCTPSLPLSRSSTRADCATSTATAGSWLSP